MSAPGIRHGPRWVPRTLHLKVPLFYAGGALVSIVAFGVVAYRSVRHSGVDASFAGLRGVLSEIVTIAELGAVHELEALKSVATSPELRTWLINPRGDSSALDPALEPLRSRGLTTAMIEVLDTHGRARATFAATTPPHVLQHPLARPLDARIGPIEEYHGTLYFTSLAPVMDGSRHLGAIRVTRFLGTSGTNRRMLQGRLGTDARLLIGNAGGNVWLADATPVKYLTPSMGEVTYDRSGRAMLSVARGVRGTPWRYAVELPMQTATAPARAILGSFLLAGALIAFVMAFLGFQVSRGITQPLVELTGAAEELAAGETGIELRATERTDEIGRLARAFDTMAQNVRLAREQLEWDLASRTGELRAAIEGMQALHDQLQESERLAIIGQMSGSVGHELRNPLGVMSTVVTLLDEMPEAPPRLHEFARLLREQIRLSQRIVDDLLDRVRSITPVRSSVDIEQLVDDVIDRIPVPRNIEIVRRLEPGIPSVLVDRDHVGQVLWNLLNNAIQAMAGEAGRVTLRATTAGDKVRVEVRDDGPGVPAGLRERVFEPLFTTKPNGVGLGLAISRAFARANGGDLVVEERAGDGACFVLTVPF